MSLPSVLIGCAITDDPNEGGFISGVHSLATGAYGKRIERNRIDLDELDKQRTQLREQAGEMESQKVQTDIELQAAQNQLNSLHTQLAELQTRLEQAKVGQRVEEKEYKRLRSEIDRLDRDATILKKDSASTVRLKKEKLEKLKEQKKSLEQALQAAVGL